ncbi:Grx4 family monothiol glutaredoxin [Montanilutibacter psychrotolerans]|uniref:Grx4 family monothiol glutaredoxin n=1 Tax=Montanilutibacter psychrotolerans TaxID=1327343 RepID=A0A3M8SQ79_9GAMM|nr:Grx4 family monothiol glutaredoxin [Lysobacter psychrotolerans]RNF82855.1 Grx4 family monothiol glutaredoxin [Lysobacter psychrotolerans]
MSLDPALRTRIETLLQSNRVVLFMKGEPAAPQCGFSAKAVGALAGLGIDYAHVDVLSDPEIREGIKVYGEWPTIPQLYIGGDLVGGSDIIEQMANSGELHTALGLPAPDRTPPAITVSDAAAQMLRDAVANAGDGYAVQVEVDARHNTKLQLAPVDATAIAVETQGLRLQFDLPAARRAQGVSIDWVDDERGRGLVIDNPNAPPKVQPLSPAEANERVVAGSLTLVDVRPSEERQIASVNLPFSTLDGEALAHLEALPKDTALAFLCHHGGRSARAAEHFRGLGFSRVFNVEGGIDAWSRDVDAHVPQY